MSKDLDTTKINVAVMGCGHIGKFAVQAVHLAPDMNLVGIIEKTDCVDRFTFENPGIPVVADVTHLPVKPDLIILTVPTRCVETVAPGLLAQGIRTVDCFDMHGKPFESLRAKLAPAATEGNSAAVMGAGVDPGISTIIRALFEVWAPTGITYVSYGPGMSMGHTVAAKSYPGVKDALSITRPGETGCHKRDLYLELEDGADLEEVKSRILEDAYFKHDEVRVFQVTDVTPLVDMGHAIHLSRKGGASGVDNQLLSFDTTFHNPASTAQVMVGSARACMRLQPGVYTMLEIPPYLYLPESLNALSLRLV
jgi:diaminopimelate dehydrogenase